MKEKYLRWRIIGCFILFVASVPLMAQPPGSALEIPTEELPELQSRLEELRRAGVPESRIMELLQQEYLQMGGDSVQESAGNAQNPQPAPGQGQPQPAPGQAPVQSQMPPPPVKIQVPIDTPRENSVPNTTLDNPTPDKMGDRDASGIFGHAIFTQAMATDSVRRLTPPRGYLIGPGDVFNVSIYGPSELFESLTVQEDGSVSRLTFGKIYMAGMTFDQARRLLEQRYLRLVDNRSTIEINLTPNPRTIGVNIVGEVGKPGYYQFPASMPAFRAIALAGGVTDLGSVRNIQVRRRGRTIHTIDIYQYLLGGEFQPFYLQEDDFIFVPVQGKVVSITGAVKRPMRYELTAEENLVALLNFAGGLQYNALPDNLELRRLEDVPAQTLAGPKLETKEVLINFSLEEVRNSEREDYQLLHGDLLNIKTVAGGVYNEASIFGSVAYPDSYQLFEGERLTDLIRRAGGLLPDAYLDRAYIVRKEPGTQEADYLPVDLRDIYPDSATVNVQSAANLPLRFTDRILIFSENTFLEQRTLRVAGRVKKPGEFTVYPSMSIKDLLYLVGGFTPDADLQNLELSLITEPEDVDQENFEAGGNPLEPDLVADEEAAESATADTVQAPLVQRISVPENWREDESLDTIRIYEFNQLRVYSKYDFIFTREIQVAGAVENPGSFPLKRGTTLLDVLYRAGGISEASQANQVELYRLITTPEKGNYGTKSPKAEIERIVLEGNWQESLLADTLDVTPYYRVVVRSEDEFVKRSFVEIKGLVQKPGRYPVLAGMSLLDLLYQAGGLELGANYTQIELTRAIEVLDENGEIIPIPTRSEVISTRLNWQEDSTLADVEVLGFDIIFVRPDPNFEQQELVFIEGEAMVPGEYVKIGRAERLSSLVGRANGVTELAYLEGAVLERENVGTMAIQLEKALRNPGSRYDIMLMEGDRLVIPARTDAVTIEGNVLQPGTIVIYNRNNHRFKHYVNLAGGFARKTRKKECTVRYVDGRVKRTRRFLFFKFYPSVEQGAVLTVPRKEEKQREEKDREWSIEPQEVLAGLTSVLTFYLLLDRALQP